MKMKTKIGTKLKTKMIASTGAVMMAAGLLVLSPLTAFAHCDTMQGPVISDAKKAIEENNINYILKWVTPENEAELTAIYEETMEVRDDSEGAKQLADEYLYENLVRIHRAGEGAAYTGLQAGPAEPIILEADKSLDTGSIEAITKHVTASVTDGIKKRFNTTLERKKHADESVAAGREFVEAYVDFTHYVERLYNNAVGEAAVHAKPDESKPTGGHGH